MSGKPAGVENPDNFTHVGPPAPPHDCRISIQRLSAPRGWTRRPDSETRKLQETPSQKSSPFPIPNLAHGSLRTTVGTLTATTPAVPNTNKPKGRMPTSHQRGKTLHLYNPYFPKQEVSETAPFYESLLLQRGEIPFYVSLREGRIPILRIILRVMFTYLKRKSVS